MIKKLRALDCPNCILRRVKGMIRKRREEAILEPVKH